MVRKLRVGIILLIGGIIMNCHGYYMGSRVLPTVYEESLSYEEQINKILWYLHHYVVSDEELKETLNKINTVTIKNVGGELGYGSEHNPIDLNDLLLEDNTTLYFSKGTFYVKGVELNNLKNITFLMNESVITSPNEYIMQINNCEKVRLIGGTFDGENRCRVGVQLKNSKNCDVEGVTFKNMGNTNLMDASGINIFGDCTGFNVVNCIIKDLTSGTISPDGFIHSYGIFVNRLGSTQEYSKNGVISNCMFDNITSTDYGLTHGDGDAIFIQAPPYNSGSGVVIPRAEILVSDCYFTDCKKRGIKVASYGVTVERCTFKGEYWFACINLQYGNGTIKDCYIENKSDYNNSITSCVVIGGGNVNILDCYMTAPYRYIGENESETKDTYHPGVRFDSQLGSSVIDKYEPWGEIIVDKCTFDGVSRALFAYDSSNSVGVITLESLVFSNCYIGEFNQGHIIDLSSTKIKKIDALSVVDFKFKYGNTRQEVASKISNDAFTYPMGFSCEIGTCFEYYSKYWLNEPMSGYDGLPNVAHCRIIYSGDMGGVYYKEYKGLAGSFIRGSKDPSTITSTLGQQLLYNSKIGDMYINVSNGGLFVCTAAGSSSSVGTWVAK